MTYPPGVYVLDCDMDPLIRNKAVEVVYQLCMQFPHDSQNAALNSELYKLISKTFQGMWNLTIDALGKDAKSKLCKLKGSTLALIVHQRQIRLWRSS